MSYRGPQCLRKGIILCKIVIDRGRLLWQPKIAPRWYTLLEEPLVKWYGKFRNKSSVFCCLLDPWQAGESVYRGHVISCILQQWLIFFCRQKRSSEDISVAMDELDNQQTFCSCAATRVGPERKVTAGLSTTLSRSALHYRNMTLRCLSIVVVLWVSATQA
jgi:hypothetical protein